MVTVYHSLLLGVRTPDSSGALWGVTIASWSNVFLAYILFWGAGAWKQRVVF